MRLQHLTQVHPGGYANGVEDDVHGSPVGQVGHILHRHDAGHDALVSVAPCHLVAFREGAGLGDPYTHQLVDAGREVVAVLTGHDPHIDDLSSFAVRHPEGGVFHVTGLLAEYRPQELLFGSQFGLALGRNLADEDVPGANLGPYADDALLVEVAERILSDVGDVARDLAGPSLVSRDSTSYFSMWMDVNFESRTMFSEMMMASSKL